MSRDGEVRNHENTNLAGVKVLSLAGRQTTRKGSRLLEKPKSS